MCVCEDSVSISGVNYMKAACDKAEVFLCSLPASTNSSVCVAPAVPTVRQSMDDFSFICAILCNETSFCSGKVRDLYLDLRNKDQQDALFFLISFNNHPLQVSNRLTIHNQEAMT
jgi:hypothetical protein